MSAPVKQDAGFRYTLNGQSSMHYLGAKLRDVAPGSFQRIYEFQSEDGTTVRRVSTSSGVPELSATLRYDGQPQSLMAMLDAGRAGATLDYFPSLANPSESYPCVLMNAGEPVQLEPDPDFWWQQRYAVAVRLRRIDGGSFQGLIEPHFFYWTGGNALFGETFTRTGDGATAFGEDGIFNLYDANLRRTAWILNDSGVLVPHTLLEKAATNQLLSSADIDPDGADWNENAAWTQVAADSCIEDEAAIKFTNDGATNSHNVVGDTPNLPATPVVFSVIVENVDALETAIGIQDDTANQFVILGTYTWATGVIVDSDNTAGSSTGVRATTLAEAGPNGGKLVRLEVWGTADNDGNDGEVFIYPTGVAVNALSAILHHAQYEAGAAATSPIVTTTGVGTRNADALSAPFTHAPQPMTLYYAGRERGNSGTAGVVQIGTATGAADERIGLAMTASTYRAIYNNGNGLNTTAAPSASPAVGDPFELMLTIDADGNLEFTQVIDGGTPEVETSATGDALPAAWNSEAIYFNATGTSNVGLMAGEKLIVSPGVKTLAEMRAL